MKYFGQKSLIGVSLISLISYAYFSQNCLFWCEQDLLTEKSIEFTDNHKEKTENIAKASKNSVMMEEQVRPSIYQEIDATPSKKQYSEDWCIADKELNDTDLVYANSEVNDWNLLQGKARAKDPYFAIEDELHYPNNIMIAPYEALPLEELRELAVNGDKWAMVAYVQNPFADNSTKN